MQFRSTAVTVLRRTWHPLIVLELIDLEPAEIVPIRPTASDDAQQVFDFLAPFVAQRKLIRRSLDEVRTLTRHGFLAEVEGVGVGFAAVEIYSRKLAEIQCLAVDPAFQKRGIGRRLVLQCLQRAREMDVMEVMVISAFDDFLRSCGFDFALPDQKKALFCQLRPRE